MYAPSSWPQTATALVQISPSRANQADTSTAEAVVAEPEVQMERPEPCDPYALASIPCDTEPPISTDTKPPRPIFIPGDNDYDGIVDATEDALASRFMPWVWFDKRRKLFR